ncbi:sodium:solute symporter family protein [Kistimonas asteriae]|uniref:sodium:solute symporter family protein n=1 Tax=Kistimonas asteriae TaxID=517724 RepID=UPI001BA4AACE|nr:sodium:solute symporter family protein [Kistimonas asteriae]
MTLADIGLGGLLLYLLILIPVCVVAWRYRSNAHSSHYLANRSLGFFVLVLTLYATIQSSNSLMGATSETWRRGFFWVVAVGYVVAMSVGYHFIAPTLRPIACQQGFVTPGDWLRHRFQNDPVEPILRRGITLIMTIVLGNMLFAQLKAIGEIAEVITGGMISYSVGVIVLALVILVYDLVGGLRAVAWTDAVQGLIMLTGLILLLVWIMEKNDSLAAITAGIAELKPESLAPPSSEQQRYWLSTLLLVGLSTVIYPQAIQRIFAAKSHATLYHSMAILGVFVFITHLIIFFVGLAAIPLFREGYQSDQMLPIILKHWADDGSAIHTLGAMMILLAILAAIMSTADSVLLSLVSLLSRDLAKEPVQNSNMQLDRWLSIFIMGALAIGALYRDVTFWRLVEIKLETLLQCMPAFIVALHWRRVSARAIFSGLLAGIGVYALALSQGYKQWQGIHIGVIALGCNLLIMLAIQQYSAWRAFTPQSPVDGR